MLCNIVLPVVVLWHPGVMPMLVACGVVTLVLSASVVELFWCVLGGVCAG